MIYNNTILYNNLVKISRNNELYKKFTKQDSFSDRLSILLIHFAFFIKYKKDFLSFNEEGFDLIYYDAFSPRAQKEMWKIINFVL